MTQMWLVIEAGTVGERVVPVASRMHVGRECLGVDERQRLLLDDPAISRDHLEIRLAPEPALVDTSSNGTRINGRRVERGERNVLADGDVITLGASRLTVRLLEGVADGAGRRDHTATARDSSPILAAIVVGDVVGYTTMTEAAGGAAVAEATDRLFGALRQLVIDHGGTVSNYAGDAILSFWDLSGEPDGVARALRSAMESVATTQRISPELALRDAAGEPLRMGWAVTVGPVASGRPSPSREGVLGDAVNLAFRLAGLAARAGLADLLVTEDAVAADLDAAFGPAMDIEVKGRLAPARVRGLA
jgi:class 3 adenylate cyclase